MEKARSAPLPYNLDNVITPTALFVGAGDSTADSGDAYALANDLPSVFHYEVAVRKANMLGLFIFFF